MNMNPNREIIRRQVQSVEFGFYGDDDVRCRSVVEITSAQSFDPTANALPGGLYDPRLGAMASDGGAPCQTCALQARQCPGHFGHIELAVPVLHPLLFGDVVAMLRLKCLCCHKLKAIPRHLAVYRAKFHLLHENRIEELLDLDRELDVAMRMAREGGFGNGGNDGDTSDDDDDDDDDEEETKARRRRKTSAAANNNTKAAAEAAGAVAVDLTLRRYQPTPNEYDNSNSDTTSRTAAARRARKLTSYERELRARLIAECRAACKKAQSNRCDHCGSFTVGIRQDSNNKIFQKALSKSARRVHAAENIRLRSALAEEQQQTAASSDSRQHRREDEGYDSDDTDANNFIEDEAEEDNLIEEGEMDGEDDGEGAEEDGDTPAGKDKYMHPSEVQAQLRRTWELEPFLCNCLFGSKGPCFDKTSYKMYFVQAVPVPPSRFRPPMHLNGMAVEHSQTQHLAKVIQLNEMVRNHFSSESGGEARAYAAWIDLQTTFNCYMDSSKDPSSTPADQVAAGIRQILERKEGLFRKNMMGKRVDYACRSVISPDPYVGANEIGLPRYFASVLTYPTPVTDLNVREMRQLVERGPHGGSSGNLSGARWVEIDGKRLDLGKMVRMKREAVAARLLTHLKNPSAAPAIVGRQLRDGDYVLMNRQPTLHKPGIMAHRVRILHNPTQRTIRMHYANCNTYNADFDGDEMNCHFPQSDLARAEAQYIASTDLQYIVPTDGTPLRGLIQDHVVGGVKMTKRDTFLERWEYQQLMFAALSSLPGLEVIRSDMEIELLPPAISKPRELWTGKQVISTLLLNLRRGNDRDGPHPPVLPGLSTERKAKTPESAFGAKQEEHLVLIRDGELLRGVLDKAAFGATDFSLVHATYEAYGPEKAGLLLNSLGRLFTAYIQYYAGHSCRMEDLVLTQKAEQTRRELIQRSYNLGARAAKAWADSEGGKVTIPPVADQPGADTPLKPVEAASACAKIGELLSGNDGKANFAALDGYMQGQLNPLASEIVKKCLPLGLAVPFPNNTFGVMTTTGAKGSIVNQSQVICALGQQALEGRRVPRLSSGRTLPSFAPYDPNPRADGFVMDRFLTGIRPQEYYFHCMAGREGLVDTAVKTSRSGYLQRCLVKHLEELKLCYDYTVRNADGNVIQFLYGEDGLDPTKASYLDCSDRSFEYMARNYDAIKMQNSALPHSTIDVAAKDALDHNARAKGTLTFPAAGVFVLARKLRVGTEWKRGALCKGWHKAVITKTRNHGKKVDLKYLDNGQVVKKIPIEVDLGRCGSTTLPAASSVATIVKPESADPILSDVTRGHRIGSSGACVSERVASAASASMKTGSMSRVMASEQVSASDLSSLIGAKYSSALCAPGEAVGSVAAQSVGEPSTQMTLNTFHLAGSGANVTLGIPRLREIIMTASKSLRTPTMSVPLDDKVTEEQALRLTRDFSRLTLMELISGNQGVSVTERLEKGGGGEWVRVYYVTIKFHPAERIREAFGLSLHDVAKVVAKNYVPLLSQNMKKELRRSAVEADVIGGESSNYVNDLNDDMTDDAEEEGGARQRRAAQGVTPEMQNDDEENEDVDEDAPTAEDGAEAAKYRRRAASVSSSDDEEDGDSMSDSDGENEDKPGNDDAASAATAPMPLLSGKTAPTVDVRSNTISLQPLQVDPSAPPLLMVGLVEKAAAAILVRSRRNIEQAFINEEDNGRGRCLQIAGVNFPEIWKLAEDVVDHTRLMSNDIWAIRCSYGVEAARTSIVDQIKSVFGAYGITVDPRHLSLIADYMTSEGGFKPMNRIGMEGSSSPFLQMSFETTANFLKKAAMAGSSDDLSSPSGGLVMGRPVQHGTGAFDVLAKTSS